MCRGTSRGSRLKLVVGPWSERMKAKRLSCSPVLVQVGDVHSLKSRRSKEAEEQKGPRSPPGHLRVSWEMLAWQSVLRSQDSLTQGGCPAHTLIWGHLTTVALGPYIRQTHGTINRGQGPGGWIPVVSAPLRDGRVQQLGRA